jgi:lipopolysaccharide transport system ATP-binding protein
VISKDAPSVYQKPDLVFLDQSHMGWPEVDAFLDIADLPQVADHYVRCTAVALCDKNGNPCRAFQQGETACFFFEFEVTKDINVPIGGVEILNDKGVIVHGKNGMQFHIELPDHIPKGSRIRFRQEMQLDIAPGEYSFNVGLSTLSQQDYARRAEYLHPDLDAATQALMVLPNAGSFAVIYRVSGQPVQLMHFGLTDLPGEQKIAVVLQNTDSLEAE